MLKVRHHRISPTRTRCEATETLEIRSIRIELAVLAAVAALGVGGALGLSLRSGVFQYEREWVRALLQAGLIAVLGIVTSAVLESSKETLQRRRDNSKLMFDVFNEINCVYLDVKLARRRIQEAQDFSNEVDSLNERQVLLELHKDNSVELFSDSEAIWCHLREMERYLNEATNEEFSSQRRGFASGGFREFSEHYHALAAAIRKDISNVRGPVPKATRSPTKDRSGVQALAQADLQRHGSLSPYHFVAGSLGQTLARRHLSSREDKR